VNVQFRARFAKDLRNIKHKESLERIKQAIEHVEKAQSQQDITTLKKLKVGSNYFRIRVGEYRIGLIIEADTAVFVR